MQRQIRTPPDWFGVALIKLRTEVTVVVEKNKGEETMSTISMKLLLESGVHFGHQTNKWNPKMKPYIFGARNGIYIIDLQQTVELFNIAYNYVIQSVAGGKEILFLGTKKQAQESIRTEAERAGMPYVNQRWLGGMLTNFNTIKRSIDRLNNLDKMFADESINAFPKRDPGTSKRKRKNGEGSWRDPFHERTARGHFRR